MIMSTNTEVRTAGSSANKTKTMALIGVMAAVTCILGPLSLAIPVSPVPISLTNLAVYFAIYVLGMRRGTISYCIYLLLGLVGLPVFSAFTGGAGKLFGPTGGYIIGFIFTALIVGLMTEKLGKKLWVEIVSMILGLAVCYAFGTAWFMFQMKMGLVESLLLCVVPYLIADALKIAFSAVLVNRLDKVIKL